ncbi:hypothetical protein Tco_1244225 [Tanacetum coccineum]
MRDSAHILHQQWQLLRGLLNGNIGYDIDNVIPEDKRFFKKKRWSADDNVIPKDKRWSDDIGSQIPDDNRYFKQKKWSADDNEIPQDKRWRGLEEEMRVVFDASIKHSFPELKDEEDAVIYNNQEGTVTPGDVNCQNVLTIWPKLQKRPELKKMYPHIKKPRDIGELIKKNLPAYAADMIDEEPSVEDVGFVTLSLSREWLAKVFSFLFQLFYNIH